MLYFKKVQYKVSVKWHIKDIMLQFISYIDAILLKGTVQGVSKVVY